MFFCFRFLRLFFSCFAQAIMVTGLLPLGQFLKTLRKKARAFWIQSNEIIYFPNREISFAHFLFFLHYLLCHYTFSKSSILFFLPVKKVARAPYFFSFAPGRENTPMLDLWTTQRTNIVGVTNWEPRNCDNLKTSDLSSQNCCPGLIFPPPYSELLWIILLCDLKSSAIRWSFFSNLGPKRWHLTKAWHGLLTVF